MSLEEENVGVGHAETPLAAPQMSHLERLKAKLASQQAVTAPADPDAPDDAFGLDAPSGAAAPAAKPLVRVAIGPEHTDFTRFPEFREFKNTEWYYQNQKFEWNLFREHAGISGARVRIDGRDIINFSSYNYLDLAGDPRMIEASKRAIDKHGTSNGSGRAITGEIGLHREFEQEIAKVLGVEDAILAVGGYSTNSFALGYLARRQDIIFYDELIHNSLLLGAKLSGARRIAFPHGNFEQLERLLRQHRPFHERAFILTEGVYSMDGDIPDIPRFIDIKRRHQALLFVDEAHSMGVIGPRGLGVVDHFGLDGRDIDIHYSSMSKAFATVGGYVAGSKALIAMLKYYAPGVLLYAAAPTAAQTAAGLEALRIMQREPQRAQRLRSNADYFRQQAQAAGFDIGLSGGSAVVPIMLRDSELAAFLAVRLFERNICTFPMMFPIVPRDQTRLRFFINTAHTHEEIDHTIRTMSELRAQAPKSKGLF